MHQGCLRIEADSVQGSFYKLFNSTPWLANKRKIFVKSSHRFVDCTVLYAHAQIKQVEIQANHLWFCFSHVRFSKTTLSFHVSVRLTNFCTYSSIIPCELFALNRKKTVIQCDKSLPAKWNCNWREPSFLILREIDPLVLENSDLLKIGNNGTNSRHGKPEWWRLSNESCLEKTSNTG